jgi:hypothetical protein
MRLCQRQQHIQVHGIVSDTLSLNLRRTMTEIINLCSPLEEHKCEEKVIRLFLKIELKVARELEEADKEMESLNPQ